MSEQFSILLQKNWKMAFKQNILLLLKTYILSIAIFSVFRILLFATELDRVDFDTVPVATILKAFVMGVRFDTVIFGYFTLLPALVLMVLGVYQYMNRTILNVLFYWIYGCFTIGFMVAAADIPYFNQFYDRFSIGAFEWFDNLGFVAAMIFQEPKYFLFIIPFLVLNTLFFFALRQIFRPEPQKDSMNIYVKIFASLVFIFILLVGIRGRLQEKSPIRIGTAYFSDNSFLNKLGLNPVYTLLNSYLYSTSSNNQKVQLMDEKRAIENVQRYLNIDSAKYNSPIARYISPKTPTLAKPNVVLVIMESMSTAKMGRYGNTHHLTPFLDSLTCCSVNFENIYTAGKHTFNGIFSTLYSFPALFRQHTMKNIKQYDGISTSLREHGYSTTYITTHDGQFDNVEGFLRANSFQNIISQDDYPFTEVKTTLGVPDDYMFRYAMPVLDKLAKQDAPFFVTFMTASDHGPFYIPEYFHPHSTTDREKIIEYADWSLRQLITMSAKQEWFDNTIFVFCADHGAPLNATYDIALNYFHSPLIVYAPKIFPEHRSITKIGSQIDIYPTIMGMLGLPYINNTLGIDLINDSRQYAILNDDDKIGVIDSCNFCIMKNNARDLQLFRYRSNDRTDHFPTDSLKALEMAEFAKSNLQVSQYMILSGQTSIRTR